MKNIFQSCILTSIAVTSATFSKAAVQINEVSYLGTAGNDQIEFINTGSSAVDISTWWICSRFSYRQLSALTLDSGSLNIGAGQLTVVTVDFDINNIAADLGLFNTNSFNSTTAMEDFVQWGTAADVGRTDVASAKGIWGQSSPGIYDFVATAGAGETLQYDGTGDGVTNWSNAANSIGAVNVVPEPSSAALLGLGAVFLIFRRKVQ